jgi:hypothetical protein
MENGMEQKKHLTRDILDSAFLSRLGNLGTLTTLASASFLGLVGFAAAVMVVVDRSGWISVACFVVWVALMVLAIVGVWSSRSSSAISSPYERLAIARKLPGAKGALIDSLARADIEGRAFVAEAKVMMTLSNHGPCYDVARRFAEWEDQLRQLIESTDLLDERWSWQWSRRPQWADDAVRIGPLTLGLADKLASYMAYRVRQVEGMIDFLQTGNEEGVRNVRALMKAEAATIEKGEEPWLKPVTPIERLGEVWPAYV